MDISNCLVQSLDFFFNEDSEFNKGEVGCLKVSYLYIG